MKEDEYVFIVNRYCLCHTTSCSLLNISHKWVIFKLKSKGIKPHSRIIKGVEVPQFSHSCNLQWVTRKCLFSLQQQEQHLKLSFRSLKSLTQHRHMDKNRPESKQVSQPVWQIIKYSSAQLFADSQNVLIPTDTSSLRLTYQSSNSSYTLQLIVYIWLWLRTGI